MFNNLNSLLLVHVQIHGIIEALLILLVWLLLLLLLLLYLLLLEPVHVNDQVLWHLYELLLDLRLRESLAFVAVVLLVAI